MSLGAALFGARAALVVPWHLREPRLGALLRPVSGRVSASGSDEALALRVSHRLLVLLARIPGSPWRNTCLYRSAAACLVLRRLGAAAHVQIGVRRDAASRDGVAAHAWVTVEGYGARDGSADCYHCLRDARS